MRIGPGLGLRLADFVLHRRELRIMPRADDANGARSKTTETSTIPISAGVVRLCSAYMFEEYGELNSDYVFVALHVVARLLTAPFVDYDLPVRPRPGAPSGGGPSPWAP